MHAGSVLLSWVKKFWAAPRVWVPVIGAIWLIAAASGLWVLWRYDNTPGEAAHRPRPLARCRDARRERPIGPTLVMLAHPHCTCTRASVGELAEAIARATHATQEPTSCS